MYQIYETKEYVEWFQEQTLKEQAQIQARIIKIKFEGHFGLQRKLDESLAELKWKNGRRIYYALSENINGELMILLLGGNKNSQPRDINRARLILRKLSGDNK